MARAASSRGAGFPELRALIFQPALLQPLGFELDLLHHVAQAVARGRRNIADTGLEPAPHRTQRLDDFRAPGRDGGIETGDIVACDRTAAVGEEQEEEQKIDVDVGFVLKRETSGSDIGQRIESQRETPEGGVAASVISFDALPSSESIMAFRKRAASAPVATR